MSPEFRERRYTAEDGLSLYFRDYGDPLSRRPPMLCLGGLTRNAKDFHSLALRLSHARRVVCPDYRGRGRSDYDDNWRNYRPEIYVNDLFHLLAAANLHGVIVCGVSLGGLLAMGLATLAPTQLAAVILDDVGPEVNTSGYQRIREYVGRDHPQPDLSAATAEVKRLFPDLNLPDEAGWRRFAEATFREGEDGRLHVDWDVNLAKALTNDVPDLWAYYRALRPLPVLALRGEVSDILTVETLGRMVEEKPDLVAVTVRGAGHVPLFDNPQVAEAIDDFLDRVDQGWQGT